MTNHTSPETVENQIQSLLKEDFLLKIKAEIETSDDEWNDEWIGFLRKFFLNGRRVQASFDIQDTFLQLVHDFTHWSERRLAAQVFDLINTLLLFKKTGQVTPEMDEFNKGMDQIIARAKNIHLDWEETHESFDIYAPTTIEEMFKLVFTLINVPSPQHLFSDENYSEQDEELRYLYSIGLYITYESFKEDF
jgi:hypothetical protein